MRVQVPPSRLLEGTMSPNQQKYLEEYERLKHIEISVGFYMWAAPTNLPLNLRNRGLYYEVLSIQGEQATLKTLHSGAIQTKTLHWCRKNLIRQENATNTKTNQELLEES